MKSIMSLVFMLIVVCFGASLMPTAIGDSIKIYPKQEYFGITKTQVIFTCQPTSSCGDTIKWFYGNTQIIESSDSNKYSINENFINDHQTLIISYANATDAGSYHCQCTFNGQAVNSPDATLTYINPVSFSTPDNEVYYAEYGSNVTLSCDIENYKDFQWQFSDGSVISTNTDKYSYVDETYLLINNLTYSDNKTFYCVGNNQITFVAKLVANVFVYKPPMVVATNATDITVVEGETAMFNCTASGHPVPALSWIRTAGALKTGNTVIVKHGTIDQYTSWSSLTLTHISSSDDGSYLCSGVNTIPKKTASSSVTFTLTVEEPTEPFLDIFTIDKTHSSINISWILAGTSSDMINISWSSSEGGVHQIHNTTLTSVTITDLIPATIYTITAEVLNTQLTDTLNESTDSLAVIPSSSSSTVIEPSSSTPIDTAPSTPLPLTRTMIITRPSTAVNEQRTTTQPMYRPTTTSTTEPTFTVRDSSTGLANVATAIPVVICVLLVIIVVATILTVICVIRRSRNSSTKNIRSIERGRRSSSRMSQGLLEPSPHNSPSIHSSNGINTANYGDTTKKMPLPPDYYPPSSNHSSQVKLHPMEIGPFEMTDNIVNSDYEASQVEMNITPPMTYNEYFSDCPAYPGDSVSQVIPAVSSQSHLLDYHSSQNDQFEYTDNSIYEGVTFKKSQSEPPSRQAATKSNKLAPVYKNLPTKQPEFGIVGNSQRGAVRENVVIKKRS